LGLIQRLEKSDPVLQDHDSHISKAEFTYHYGMELMEEKTNSEVNTCLQIEKCFSVIANCVPDISNVVYHSNIFCLKNMNNDKMKGKTLVHQREM